MREDEIRNQSPCPYCGTEIPEGEWERETFDYHDQEATWRRGVDLEYVFNCANDSNLYFVANCPACKQEVMRCYKATGYEFSHTIS